MVFRHFFFDKRQELDLTAIGVQMLKMFFLCVTLNNGCRTPCSYRKCDNDRYINRACLLRWKALNPFCFALDFSAKFDVGCFLQPRSTDHRRRANLTRLFDGDIIGGGGEAACRVLNYHDKHLKHTQCRVVVEHVKNSVMEGASIWVVVHVYGLPELHQSNHKYYTSIF